MVEALFNQYVGNLQADIAAGAVSAIVAPVPVGPAATDHWRVLIRSEWFKVTHTTDNMDGTATLTIVGAQEGSSAANHGKGSQVRSVLTAATVGNLLTVEEVDGSPSLEGVRKLVLPNGTLGVSGTTATYTPAGGGGAGAATANELAVIQFQGVTLTAGTPVIDAGGADSPGSGLIIVNRTAGADQNDMVVGCIKADIANGATGTVVTFGEIDNVDTTAWSDGDELFLDSGIGAVTNSPPFGLQTTRYAIVLVAGSAAGSIFVLPQVWNGTYKHGHQNDQAGGPLTSIALTNYVDVQEIAAPASPASGYQRFYVDSTTHHWTRKTSGGVVQDLG